jgi:queuosine precursor transporter
MVDASLKREEGFVDVHETLQIVYVTLVVCSLAGAGKLVGVGPLVASATAVLYQASFALIDYVNEMSGAPEARAYVRNGFIALTVALICFIFVILLPSAPGFDANDAYVRVFSSTPRIAGAGLVAFAVAQLENVWLYDLMRRRVPRIGVALRSAIATAIAQFVDTVIFVAIAFFGVVPDLAKLLLGQYAVKLVFVALSAPLIGLAVRLRRR